MASSVSRLINATVSQGLSWSWRFSPAKSREPLKAATALRSLLRRFPYWREGHRLLAEAALSERDLATAYAATHCFRVAKTEYVRFGWLASRKQAALLESQWKHLLGRCFLAAGDAAQALPHLQTARLSSPNESSIAEDEVAALMALGRNDEAAQVLCTIPKEHLSMSAKVAGDYLRNSHSDSAEPRPRD